MGKMSVVWTVGKLEKVTVGHLGFQMVGNLVKE